MIVCPDGWRLPSNADWDNLINAVGGLSTAGGKLKADGNYWDGGEGTNDYGFSALPGGRLNGQYNWFDDEGSYGYWWSIDENFGFPYLLMSVYDNYVTKGYSYNGHNLHSVRCIKDD
jgi:uncharacterized protein (TIGR02145 family)